MQPTAIQAKRVYAASSLGLACILSFTLLAIRRFTRTEAAVQGETLWLTAGWAVVAMLVIADLANSRARPLFSFRIRMIDVAAVLIVSGQLTSTLVVFFEHGDRRAAVNLTTEWIGWMLAWFSLRVLSQRLWFRQLVIGQFLCLVAGLALYGIWQHHVFYPAEAVRYQQNVAAIDAAKESGMATAASRMAEAEFRSGGVPAHPIERMLFERRLLDSSEPFGPFALANTLAGFLAAATVLLASVLVSYGSNNESGAGSRNGRRQALWLFLVCLPTIAVLYCLVLTKSRSAWIGTFAGLAVLLFMNRSERIAKLAVRGALGLAAVGIVSVIGMATGAIDREVLMEAPRSIQFRLMYWIGSLRMLSTRPLFGAGPGNFRQHYLPFRVPESSEAIADPHNILLDAWATGGVLSLLGIVILLLATLLLLRKQSDNSGSPDDGLHLDRAGRLPGLMGVVLSSSVIFVIAMAGMRWWYQAGEIDTSEKMILGTALIGLTVWCGLTWAGRNSNGKLPGVAAVAALTWMVHLLAAGGFQMPAAMQDIALLIIVAAGGKKLRESEVTRHISWIKWPAFAVLATICGFALLQTDATYRSERLRIDGQYYQAEGNFRLAERQTRAAIDTDPWSVRSRQQLAGLLTYGLDRQAARVLNDETTDNRAEFDRQFEELMATIDALLDSDRQYAAGYRSRAAAYWLRYQTLEDIQALDQAIENQKVCVERNPTDARIRVELAQMYDAAGDIEAAATEAEKALRLEAINQEWNHIDRFLPEASKENMLRITASASEEPARRP